MTREDIKEKYKFLYVEYSAEEENLTKGIRQYGIYRILFFLVLIIMVILSTSWSWTAFGIILGTGILIFGFLVRRHGNMHRRKARLEKLVKINREGMNAMDGDFSDLDSGREYLDGHHLFSHDLDLFGRGSLFQYINRTSTIPEGLSCPHTDIYRTVGKRNAEPSESRG